MTESEPSTRLSPDKLNVLVLCANPLLGMGLSRAISDWDEFCLLDPALHSGQSQAPQIVITDEHTAVPSIEPLLQSSAVSAGPRVALLVEKLAANITPPFPVAAYLHVSIEPLRLKMALLTMACGDYWLDGSLRNAIPSRHLLDVVAGNGYEGTGLTAREFDVLKLVAAGLGNSDIAAELFISVPTVKAHLRSILQKLKAVDRTHAAVVAVQKGWFAVEARR